MSKHSKKRVLVRVFILFSVVFSLIFKINAGAVVSIDDFLAKSFSSPKYSYAMPYRLFVPKNYDTAKVYPLVVFMHDDGQRGTDNQLQISTGNDAKVWAEPFNQAVYPCFVLAPQLPTTQSWSDKQSTTVTSGELMIIDIINTLKSQYKIDSNRIYCTGITAGGGGAWDIYMRYPNVFAASVPVSGFGHTSMVGSISKKPLWAFHSDADMVVSVQNSRDLISALISVGGTPKYTEYKGVDANTGNLAYGDRNLLPWVFAQKLGQLPVEPTPGTTPNPDPGPDLVVTDIICQPDNPKIGDQVVFGAIVKNIGDRGTPDGVICGVRFNVDGKNISWSDTYTTTINPGDSVTLTANNSGSGINYWTMASGTHNITAYVDDINRIYERYKDNNIYNKPFPFLNTTSTPQPAATPSPTPTIPIVTQSPTPPIPTSTPSPSPTMHTVTPSPTPIKTSTQSPIPTETAQPTTTLIPKSVQIEQPVYLDYTGTIVNNLKANGFINTSVKATNVTQSDIKATMIFALYKPSGIIQIFTFIEKLLTPNSTIIINSGFSLPNDVIGFYAKVFVWDSLTGMKPLSDSFILLGPTASPPQ